MRLYELYDNVLKNGAKQTLYNVKYTWDAQRGRWMDPRGVQAGGAASAELMKAVGKDPSGRPLSKSGGVLGKVQRAIDRKIGGSLSGGIDPSSTVLGKAMGQVGAAIGRGLAKAIAPNKVAAKTPSTPIAPQATQAAPKPTQVNNPAVQNLNNYVKGVAAELNKPGANKIALTKELVNFMADRKGTPEWENASDSMKVILKRAGLNPNFANTALQRIQAGQKFESLQAMFIDQLLETVGLTFEDLGITALLVESQNGHHYYVVEDNTLTQLKKLAGI
jgi:hypothetical protein